MLSVVSNEKTFGNIVMMSVASLAIIAWIFYLLLDRGLIAASISTILVIIALLKIRKFVSKPSKNDALSIFKFANSVVVVIFVLARFY